MPTPSIDPLIAEQENCSAKRQDLEVLLQHAVEFYNSPVHPRPASLPKESLFAKADGVALSKSS
jgi:hypothetical protein